MTTQEIWPLNIINRHPIPQDYNGGVLLPPYFNFRGLCRHYFTLGGTGPGKIPPSSTASAFSNLNERLSDLSDVKSDFYKTKR